MELMELSSQLKTVDIVDSQSISTLDPYKIDNPPLENRRLTRSKSLPKSDVWRPTPESSIQKSSRKILDPEDEIRNIYLNNKVKLVHKNLETIFEDPIVRRGSTMFLGIGKQKRSLYLCREFRTATKQKSKMRKSRIKKLGKRGKPCKMSDDEFREKMMRIDDFISGDSIENGIEKDGMENHTISSFLFENCNEMQAHYP